VGGRWPLSCRGNGGRVSRRPRVANKSAAERRKSAAHSLPRTARGGASRGLTPERETTPKGRKKQKPLALPADLRVVPIPLADEISRGDSIADKLRQALRQRNFAFEPGDILVVKHKIVSKAEGRIVDLATINPSANSIAWAKKYKLDARVIELALRESRAVIRRKNGVLITETRHGFICANSGVDVPTSMADATRCFCRLIPTAPLVNFIVT